MVPKAKRPKLDAWSARRHFLDIQFMKKISVRGFEESSHIGKSWRPIMKNKFDTRRRDHCKQDVVIEDEKMTDNESPQSIENTAQDVNMELNSIRK